MEQAVYLARYAVWYKPSFPSRIESQSLFLNWPCNVAHVQDTHDDIASSNRDACCYQASLCRLVLVV